jgi:periplasmic protein TonB
MKSIQGVHLEGIMPTATVPELQVRDGLDARETLWISRIPDAFQTPQRLPGIALFADVLLDSGRQDKNGRKFTTVLSFAFQGLLIGILLIVPMMLTEALPQQQLLTFLVAPPPPPPPPAAQALAKVVRQTQSDLLSGGQLRTPSRIPEKVQMIHEEEAPPALPSMGGVVGGVPGGVPGGQLGGVIGGIISQTSSLSAIPKFSPPTPPKRVRVSQGITKGFLIQKIEPKYPSLALAARIWGQVVLQAIISKDGEIKELSLVSGHPVLAPAAIEAVRQWRYRPYLLNGAPVEVETTVTVTFLISQ